MNDREGRLRIGLLLVVVATALRIGWALAVPTIPVGDFATYRESANYLVEWRRLDPGFIYMPGLVLLLAAIQASGGEVVAAKLMEAAFGGLAVAPLYVVAAHLIDDVASARVRAGPSGGGAGGDANDDTRGGAGDGAWRTGARAPRLAGAPVAFAAGVLYALWPAGIATASVIGTDIPAAAWMLLALAFLCGWSTRRPWLASATFGAAMGVAAYFRAVALPLAGLSLAYWLTRRVRWPTALARTAVAVAATLMVLSPWALRNLRTDGHLAFTDSHGGITALMGNNPNTDGTYARSLGVMFHDLTGRTFLSEPHRETDRVAYAMAKRWMTFEPWWTAGMIALRLERLFAPERGLLYWPIFRPGVLPAASAAWFGNHWVAASRIADWFYVAFIAFFAAGVAFAATERRAAALVPVLLALALAATYALFVAEPRYRLTTEVLLFPIAGLGAARLAGCARRGWRELGDRLRGARSGGHRAAIVDRGAPWHRADTRGLIGATIVAGALAVGALAVVRGGAALRDRHRWAATLCRVDGRPWMTLWRGRSADGGRSAVQGTATGVRLGVASTQHEAEAELILPDLVLPAAGIEVSATLAWADAAPGAAILELGPARATAENARVHGVLEHRGGPVRLRARLVASQGGAAPSVEITDVTLQTVPKP